MNCPRCDRPLKRVPKPSWMNSDQWDAVKAGDYFCEACPSNDRGNGPFHYFWASEVEDADRVKCEAIMHI